MVSTLQQALPVDTRTQPRCVQMQETHTLEKKDWATRLMAVVVVVTMVTSTLVMVAPQASARTGSDDYGYTFKDSAESDGPTYDWIELVGNADATTLITSSTDGGQGQFDLPFTFEYYENEYTTWGNGGDNGYITFGSVVSNQWTSYRIPASQLGVAVPGGWFDGGFCRASNPTAGVYYATIGTEPNRKFVVQYQDQGAWYPSVYQCPGTAAANALTWQIILHEGSNQITMQYKDTDGGYYSDNEYLTSGVQGKPGGTLTGLEYVYRRSPSAITDETAVTFSPPPPPRNDLRLTGSTVPDPISLAESNIIGGEVTNMGVNCDTAGSCTPVAETDIDVTAKAFSITETATTYDFDADDGGFTPMTIQGQNKWTNALNDGKGNHNYGDDGSGDGAWSSGRKSATLGGMFNDNQQIHYDGTDILVADDGSNSVLKLSTSTHSTSTILGPDLTYLRNVLDVTTDDTHYYTLSRSSSTYSYTTYVCKWAKSDGAREECNTSNVRYGVSLTHYDGEIFALQGGSTSTSYRKVIILDATDMSNTGNSIAYNSGVSAYYYANVVEADVDTGDIYISYRDFYGRVRAYELQDGGGYCASSSCYSQVYTYARYHNSLDVEDGYVYTAGYYYSSYYGGMKKYATGSSSVSTLWSMFSDCCYKGSTAVTSDGDIYVASNYAYRYYSFYNWDDKIFYYEDGDTDGSATEVLGPNPASVSALSTPAIDTSSAVGMTMSFKISYQMYWRYEGAYMEASNDGGNTWSYISGSDFTQGGYYGTTYNYYGNPLSTSLDAWTYYNTDDRYSYNTHTAPWKTMEVDLGDYTGYSDVRFRWVVGFNQYDNTYYYDSYFRLDDVVVTVKEADVTYAEETQTIASLGFKEKASLSFFEPSCSDGTSTTQTDCENGGGTWDSGFRPASLGLAVGDKICVTINVEDNGGDEDMSNNRAVHFREVKYVIFADNFDDGDIGDWTTGKVKYGSGDSWAIRDGDSNSGSYSLDSGFRTQHSRPADNYASTPDLNLVLPVEAEVQMFISYYNYYTYDGYQLQVSEDSGESWSILTPDGGYPGTILNYAYYANPLRGQPGFTYYGSNSPPVYSWSPDPQAWIKVTADLTPYVGQDDVRLRMVNGWSTIPTSYSLYESFMRMDDVAVTGLVYNDNVGVSGLDLPDPIGIDATIPVGTTVINAGINDHPAGDAKLRLQIGPLGVQTLDSSDDLESYANQAAAEAAGWSEDDDCSTYASNNCVYWGNYGGAPGFTFNTDEGDGDETNSWGSDGAEFQMYYGGGSTEVVTPGVDFTGAPSDLKMTLKHRYNFDYYSGYPSYNGGQVQISTDSGATWAAFTPNGGYPGTMYNYAGYGNPLYGQSGFVHCGSCPGSGAASDDADEYITSTFDLSEYVDATGIKFRFMVGMYNYQWPGDGEHWHIDSMTFSGTGMESIAYEEMVGISGSGLGGMFMSGDQVEKVWNYHFQVPGEYKIIFDSWIGESISDGDDFLGDNQVSAARTTMFTVVSTDADESALSKKNNELNQRLYDSGWMSTKDGGPVDSYQWIPSSTSASEMSHSPVWWSGPDAFGNSYDGDDTSLVSPVFDLSTATSAKLVFDHRYFFHGYEYSWANYYYDGGRIEISSDGGTTWSELNPTAGEGYGGTIYNYAYYGNPLRGLSGFTMGSSAGSSFVETQCDLAAYTGEGFDNVRIRFRLGGTFFLNPTFWDIDNVGVYALGFDLAQTSDSTPYSLEVGESSTITTSFKNHGMGSLGAGGPVTEAFAKAYMTDISGLNELWSETKPLGDLAMAYYDENDDTHPGESTGEISFEFPGYDTAGMYTVGVKVADSNGETLGDLFPANNDANHMLAVGLHADMGDPVLSGGSNWATDSETGTLSVSWDQTDIAADSLAVSIGGQSGGYSPSAPVVQLGTEVTWTNADTSTHTVTDKEAQFDSFDIAAGESFAMTFTEVGTFNYYCKYHVGMEGSITVVASALADEQARTNYMEVWSPDSYLVFWASFDMADDDEITVKAQKKGAALDDPDSIGLWGANGFKIMNGMDHSEVGDALTRSSEWNPYYIYLDSKKLGYNSLAYKPSDDNSYAFVFQAKGTSGSASIGGVQLIRTLDNGFVLDKKDVTKLTYDIFPTLAVSIDYYVKNIGTQDNTFSITPELSAQGKPYGECSDKPETYDTQDKCEAVDEDNNGESDYTWYGEHNWAGLSFDVSIEVVMNGDTFDEIVKTSNDDGTWIHEFDMSPDDEAVITIRFGAPDYDQEKAEPAGNRKFDVSLNPHDVNSAEDLREPIAATLFIKPSQFVMDEITFNRVGVIEGDSLDITAKVWNEGNYASDVLVVFYVMDTTGEMYSTPEGNKRMSRVASTTVDMMAPKPVLEDQGVFQTWYYATATWDEAYIPRETVQDFETVTVYGMINPQMESEDEAAGLKMQDEYLNQQDDNDATNTISVVKAKASTPSFAVGILGMSIAALVAAVGASLRREEE